MEGRKAAVPVRTGVGLAHSYPPHIPDHAPASGGPVSSTENAWGHSGKHVSTTRGTATTMSDVLYSGGRVRHDNHDHPHHHSADMWRRQEPTSTTTTHRDPAAVAVAGHNIHTPSAAFVPPPPGHPPPPIHPPLPLSASSLRESLRQRGGRRSPSPAAAAAAAARPTPSLRPRPHDLSPVRLDDRRVGFGDGHRQEVRPRPQPRRAPSEASSGDDDHRGEANSDGRSTGCMHSGGAGDDCGSKEEMGGGVVGGRFP